VTKDDLMRLEPDDFLASRVFSERPPAPGASERPAPVPVAPARNPPSVPPPGDARPGAPAYVRSRTGGARVAGSGPASPPPQRKGTAVAMNRQSMRGRPPQTRPV